MIEHLTPRAHAAMKLARQEAHEDKSEVMTPEHILIGMLQGGHGVATEVLKSLGADFRRLCEELEKRMTPATSATETPAELPLSPSAKRTIELASEEALQIGQDVIATQHLLLALLARNEGISSQVLANLGLTVEVVRGKLVEVLDADLGRDAHPPAPGA